MTRAAVTLAFILTLISLSVWAQDKGGNRILARPKIERAPKSMKIVEGKVAEISDSKVVIENDYGARKELKLSSKTKFQLTEKKHVKLTEVKPGTFVKIAFRPEDLTATKVQETVRKFRE